MFTTLFSFLGSSLFRTLWGEISAAWTSYQDHKHEIERMKVQGMLEAEAHSRNLESQRLQSELGIKVIEVQAAANLEDLQTSIWGDAVRITGKKTGWAIVDVWNGVIRPALATLCMILITLHLYRHNWVLDEMGWALVGAALGMYVADRSLFKRGK